MGLETLAQTEEEAVVGAEEVGRDVEGAAVTGLGVEGGRVVGASVEGAEVEGAGAKEGWAEAEAMRPRRRRRR